MDERIKRFRGPAARLSRRGFFNSAGAASAGLFAASVLPGSAMADDDDDDRKGGHATASSSLNALPNPIPHTAPTPFGTTLHSFFPGPVEGTATNPPEIDPTGAHPNGRDPSLIFDFSGFIGEADLSLTGTGTDLNTGVKAAYNFNGDVRFMKGTYVGTDGKAREGTFAFIWLDSQPGGSPLGFHSYDPGITQTLVVWVAAVPNGSAHVDLDRGEASFRARNIGVLDAFTVENSLTPARTLGNPVAAQIDSLEINWKGIFRRVAFSSSAEKFAGNYVENAVTIEVTMTTLGSTGHGFRFVSNPASTTVSHFAQIGLERNGKFF